MITLRVLIIFLKCVFGFSLVYSAPSFCTIWYLFDRARARNQNFCSPSCVNLKHKTYNFQLKNIKQFDNCATEAGEEEEEGIRAKR